MKKSNGYSIVCIAVYALAILLMFVNFSGINFYSSSNNCTAGGCFGNSKSTTSWADAKAGAKNDILTGIILLAICLLIALILAIVVMKNGKIKAAFPVLALLLTAVLSIVAIVLWVQGLHLQLGSSHSSYDGTIGSSTSVGLGGSAFIVGFFGWGGAIFAITNDIIYLIHYKAL
jgi:ABC-type sugar transport system permease subunit